MSLQNSREYQVISMEAKRGHGISFKLSGDHEILRQKLLLSRGNKILTKRKWLSCGHVLIDQSNR